MSQKQYWQFEIFGTDPDLIGFYGSAGIVIPSGNTAARPASPVDGHFRFNTSLNSFEGYEGGWITFATTAIPTFDGLSDTPVDKVGAANRVMIVNSGETDIEYSSNLLVENSGRLTVPGGYESLVDADTVITNKRYTDDQDNLQLFLTGGLMGGNITMGSNAILGLPLAPTASTEATSKSYVDGLFAGIDRKESVNLATTTDLDTETGDTWVAAGAKVGKTLTSDANTATIDGVAVANGDRILVKNEVGDIDNGIYDVSGVSGAAVVFTRSDDTDGSPANEVNGGATTFVVFGSTNDLTQWSVIANGAVDVDVDAMVWTITGGFSLAFLPLGGGVMTGSITMGAAGIQIIGDTAVAAAPTYSFTGDLGTGLHQVAGAGTMSFVISTAAIWNISSTAFTPAVNVTQDIGSTGLKVKNIYADHFLPNFGAAGDPSYSFEGDATTGMYNGGSTDIRFAVGGTRVITIESNGTLSANTASYETLVLADNDIPNKKYVDDSVASTSLVIDADGDTKVDVEEGGDDDTIRMDAGNNGTHGPITDIFVLNASAWTVDMGGSLGSGAVGAPISISAGDAGGEGGSASGGSVTIAAGNPATSGDGGSIILDVQSGTGAGDDGSISFQRNGTEFLNFSAGSGLITSPDGAVATNPGENITLTAGAGNTTGAGGAVNIDAGDSGGGATGDGGTIGITSGAATSTNGSGGDITIATGIGTGIGNGGSIDLTGGNAGTLGYGGYINITAGDSAAGRNGGQVNILGGGGVGGSADDSSDGGAVNITGGTSAASTSADGGAVNITGGTPGADADSNGGAVNISGGDGDTLSGGGAIAITAGDSAGTQIGGAVDITAGDAGGGSAAGGSVNITAGNPATSGDGGSITLTAGVGAGAGSSGAVVIPDSTAPTVTTNKLYSVSGALTWNSIDLTGSNQYTEAFDDGDLTAGVIAITHSLGRQYNQVTVYDNNDIIIQPDTVTATSTSVTTIDLTSFGTLTGTWNVVVS